MGVVRYAIFNDIHFPYEDRQRYSIALKILSNIKFLAHIYLNGDIGEFQSVSAHPIHPSERSLGFMEELTYLNMKLDQLQEMFPGIPVTLVEGNHCYRFFRYIRDVAPQMWGLIDCPQLLKFPDRPGYKFVTYGPTQLVKCGDSNLYLRHEPLGGGASHAKSTAEKSYIDIAYGHTHQHQSYTHRKFGPIPIVNKAYSLGWLGDRTRHVFDYRGSKDNWVEGFSIVECDEESGDYSLEFIDLRKIPVFYRGEKFNAKNEDGTEGRRDSPLRSL